MINVFLCFALTSEFPKKQKEVRNYTLKKTWSCAQKWLEKSQIVYSYGLLTETISLENVFSFINIMQEFIANI